MGEKKTIKEQLFEANSFRNRITNAISDDRVSTLLLERYDGIVCQLDNSIMWEKTFAEENKYDDEARKRVKRLKLLKKDMQLIIRQLQQVIKLKAKFDKKY
jgi:hypothetical protein